MSVLIVRTDGDQRKADPSKGAGWRQLALAWSTPPALYGPRPARCPGCGAGAVTAQFGSAYCRTCGHKWAYGEVAHG